MSVASVKAGSLTFNYTGSPQPWIVPAGLTEISYELVGASGGNATGGGWSVFGGRGGKVTGKMTVTPGETLTFFVGGAGNDATAEPVNGGWNGGGNGKAASGSGGGGATDIRRGGVAISHRIVVAGGGGGGNTIGGYGGGGGGDGGPLNGVPGTGDSGDGGGGGGGNYGGLAGLAGYIGGPGEYRGRGGSNWADPSETSDVESSTFGVGSLGTKAHGYAVIGAPGIFVPQLFLDNFESDTLSHYTISPSGSGLTISGGKLNVATSTTARSVRKVAPVEFPVGATVSVDFGIRNIFDYSSLAISSDAAATNSFEIGRGTYNGGSSHGLVGWSDDLGFDLSPSIAGNNRIQTDGNPMTLKIKRTTATEFTISYLQGTLETAIYTVVDPEWSGSSSVYLMLKTARDTGTSTITFDNLSVAVPFYTISVTPNSNGLILGGGIYAPGSYGLLTAVANNGYIFSHWSGDVSGSTNPLNLLIDGNKSVGATFSPDLSDADSDGISNYHEAVVYGTDPNDSDTDNDGLSDGYELGIGRYSIVTGSFTWAQADAHSGTQGGALATFTSQGEWDRAMLALGPDALVPYTGLWIGASDAAVEGAWNWVTGEPFSYSRWATNRPDGTGGNGNDYVEVSGGDGGEMGKWYDRASTSVRPGYILETGFSTSPTDSDSDDDGLKDGAEITAGTNPFDSDSDDDGLTDGQEVLLTNTDPTDADSDGDGTGDADEDSDGDGLSNTVEISTYGTHPGLADTDGDGLRDDFELGYGRYSLIAGSFTWEQARLDAIGRNGHLVTFTSPAEYDKMLSEIGPGALDTIQGAWIGATDQNQEGTWAWVTGEPVSFTLWASERPSTTSASTLDFAEISGGEGGEQGKWYDRAATSIRGHYILELGHPTNPLLADTDGDGINDGAETSTLPNVADSDNDGWADGAEIEFGGNPADGGSAPKFFLRQTIPPVGNTVVLRFPGQAGASYRLEASDSLTGWGPLETGIPGNGHVIERTISRSGFPKRFFKVGRE